MHHSPQSNERFPLPKWTVSPAKALPFPFSSTPRPPAKMSEVKSAMQSKIWLTANPSNPPGHGFKVILYIKYMYFSTFLQKKIKKLSVKQNTFLEARI